MNSDVVTHPKINWPNGGRNARFMVLNVPSLTHNIVHKCLTFISSNCCYVSSDRVKRFIAIHGIKSPMKTSSDPIQLEHFLAEIVDRSHVGNARIDYNRYQTAPSDSDRLLKCESIKKIVLLTQNIVNKQLVSNDESIGSRYVVTKVTLLFSKPGGPPQEMHCDDGRDDPAMEETGEMLSAIVALQDNTRLDVEGDNGKRLTYSIPQTSMFLFSGRCKHGGSSYIRYNVRLHMCLMPESTRDSVRFEHDNVIVVNLPCPIKDCEHSEEGETFGKSQLYYHWNRHHLEEVGLSLGKFIQQLRGIKIFQCDVCRRGFNTKRGLAKHKKHTCRPRK